MFSIAQLGRKERHELTRLPVYDPTHEPDEKKADNHEAIAVPIAALVLAQAGQEDPQDGDLNRMGKDQPAKHDCPRA
eukprot:SAG31_NODE_22928_length_515_cov_0.742788_1_plen_76_part_10